MKHLLRGHLDRFVLDAVEGWAFDECEPQRRVDIVVYDGDRVLSTVCAAECRADLREAGMGDGGHAFSARLPDTIYDGRPHSLHVRFAETGDELPNSPCAVPALTGLVRDFKLDPHNIATVLEQRQPRAFKYLAIDINDTCNAQCIYCPNPRSSARLALDDFERFLAGNVRLVDTLQFGCGQEPTVDPRLVDFFRVLRRGAVQPRVIRMITNGVRLDRHDVTTLYECGLTTVVFSLDAVRPETNDRLRPGAPFERVVDNLRSLRRTCPAVQVELSITVTAVNIGEMSELVSFGKQLGVGSFSFREITDHSQGRARHSNFSEAFAGLALGKGEFARMQREVVAAHGTAGFLFLPRASLEDWFVSAADGAAVVTGPAR